MKTASAYHIYPPQGHLPDLTFTRINRNPIFMNVLLPKKVILKNFSFYFPRINIYPENEIDKKFSSNFHFFRRTFVVRQSLSYCLYTADIPFPGSEWAPVGPSFPLRRYSHFLPTLSSATMLSVLAGTFCNSFMAAKRSEGCLPTTTWNLLCLASLILFVRCPLTADL